MAQTLPHAAGGAEKFTPASESGPYRALNVDVEPVGDGSETYAPVTQSVTRIVVDDPGVSDEPEEQETADNAFRPS